MKTNPLIAIVIALCLCSCIETTYYEKDEVLSADRTKLVAVSEKDIPEGEDTYDQNIYDTIIVRTNRSFHAGIVPEVDWVSVVESDNINLSGISTDVPVVLIFARNHKEQPRSASLVLSSEGKSITISLTQKAPEYYIKTEVDRDEVLGVRDTCTLKVRSNTKWTAAIDKSKTTAEVSITKFAGRDNGSLQICFGMNDDFENSKVATVVISADGCESKTVQVKQKDGSPFVTFIESAISTKPEDEYVPVTVTANVPWTLETVSSSFVNGVVVTRASYFANPKNRNKWVEVTGGEYVEGYQLAFVADHGADPTVIKEATLKVATNDGTYSNEISFSQRGCIHLDFLDINPETAGTDTPYRDCYDEATWPFEYPSYTEMCFTWNGCMLEPERYPFDGHVYGEVETVLKCGYSMIIRTNGYEGESAISGGGGFFYAKNKKGLQLSYSINGYDYLKTPIVSGMALKKVIFEPSVLGVNTACMRQFGNSLDATILPDALPGAVQWKYINAQTAYEEHTPGYVFEYEFPSPEKNTSYRLQFEQAKCCSSIKELVFIYE